MIGLLSRRVLLTWVAGLAASVPVFLAARPATAEQPPAVPGRHQHEDFYLRLTLGPSGLAASSTVDSEDVTVSGAGGSFHVALGYNLLPGLVVFGELFDYVTLDPEVEIDGGEATDLGDTSLGLYGVGAGVAYHFWKNVHVSASIAAAQLIATAERESGEVEQDETDFGFGVNLVIGKEFWVSDNWALGVAGQVFLGAMSNGEANEDWGVGAIGASLSATYD
jgi:hypothetical protein